MSTAAVPTTATVVPTTTTVVPTTTTVEATTYIATTSSPAVVLAPPVATLATPVARVMFPAVTVAPTVMVPGTSTDEGAAVEPLRAIVAVRCTSIRGVCVVAVLTYGRRRRRFRVTPADLDSK
jgi:hypothetical protein